MRRWWFVVVCLGLCWGLWGASRARADAVVVIVPPELEPGVSADEGERAVGAITERLRADGYSIITPGQAASALAALGGEENLPGEGSKKSAHDCTSEACAVAFRAFFDSEVAAQVTLFRRLDTGAEGASSVSVALLGNERTRWSGRAGIANGDVEVAVLQALTVARKRRAGGAGPMLSVEGSPEGARVLVDGRPAGVLPYQASITPGAHEVEVRGRGLATETRTVRVGGDPDGEVRVQVDLKAAPPAPERVAATLDPTPEAPQREAPAGSAEPTAAYDYLVGGGLMAAAAVLGVIVPATTAAKSGQCTSGETDVALCPEVYGMDGGVWAQLAIGAALAGAGALVMWKRPIQLRLGGDRRSARVTLRHTF